MALFPCRDTERNLRRGIARDTASLLVVLCSSSSSHLPANLPHKLNMFAHFLQPISIHIRRRSSYLYNTSLFMNCFFFFLVFAEILTLQLTSSLSVYTYHATPPISLAKERVAQDTHMSNMYGIQASDPSFESSGYESYHKMLLQEEREISPKGCNLTSRSSLNDANGSDLMFTSFSSSSSEEAHSLVDFKTRSDEWAYTNGSLLSFEQGDRISHPTGYSKMGHEDEYMSWVDAMDLKIECDYLNSKCAVSSRLSENLNSYETASSNGSMKSTDKDNRCGDERCGWLYPAGDGLQDSGLSQGCFNKRPHMGGDVQTSKKHCPGEAKKPKTKPIASKDPQSIAAKHRRERITERLKILQDLVPNGPKVDLVTMLEKAISYVKFLQLQVKVLATDEFWPSEGGKAPEAAQVKEAIDAILSSHRNRDSSSK